VVGAVGAASSLLAAFGGKTATTGFRADPGSARKLFTFDIIVGTATFVALVGLLILMGRAEFALAEALARPLSAAGRWSMVLGHLLAAGLIAAALLVTARFINVNRFSLNGMYRNRLARAFLGAARETRDDADPFTGFAPSDNIRLHALKAVNGATGRRVLMPVVNVALNLVGGPRLAWQERKAQAFVFTPLACGSAALAEDEATGRGKGRYIPSEIYAGSEPDLGLPGQGVSLATAVAISGAAASPSMGYHSSPPTAFLMTLFNVRLGAWLPNPGRDDLPGDDIKASAPKNALRPLLRELLGLTDARGRSVTCRTGAISRISASTRWCVGGAVSSSSAMPAAIPARPSQTSETRFGRSRSIWAWTSPSTRWTSLRGPNGRGRNRTSTPWGRCITRGRRKAPLRQAVMSPRHPD
jgi:hypothetical protein